MPARPRTSLRKAPTPRTPARGRAAVPDAIAMLEDDHRNVAAMFEQFDKLRSDGVRKAQLVARLCQALTVHAKVEEEIFYPAARSVLEDPSLIDPSDVEHAMARSLIADVESAKPGDGHYDAKVQVLGEYVRHHVRSEQEKLFPKLRRTHLDMKVLGERIAVRKRELAGMLSNPSAGDDAMRRFVPLV